MSEGTVKAPLQRVRGRAVCIYPGKPEDGCQYKGCGLPMVAVEKDPIVPEDVVAFGCEAGHRCHFRVKESLE